MTHNLGLRAAVLALALLAAGCSDSITRTDEREPDDPRPVSLWSDPATWPGGAVPAAGAEVVIPADRNVKLDVSPPALKRLQVDGRLFFDARDLSLTVGSVMVHGTLQIGSEQRPHTHRAVITLTGGDPAAGMANKAISVMGGQLRLHGERRLSWTRLNATVAAGANRLVLAERPDWRAGDRIVIASSEFDYREAEDVGVVSVSGNAVTLDRALTHAHWGELQTFAGRTLDARAEVGLLTRNIVIQGDEASVADGFGGHIMVMSGGSARVEGVQLFRMGQAGGIGRYPLHWHMRGDASGDYARSNSIWQTFNRCLTVHGTHNVRVEDNVAYDARGHCYFLEDGVETGNSFIGNLGLSTRRPLEGKRLLASDNQPATYWITNPDNVVRGNSAAGSAGFGFWYALPEHPTGLSATNAVWPRRTPLREFSDNTAHSNDRVGLHVDDGPRPSGETEVTWYQPVTTPTDRESPAVVADFRGFTGYKHRGGAVWLRGRAHRLTGAVLADNGIGATFASSESYMDDAVVVGESANSARPLQGFPIRGFEFYDGRVGTRRSTFVNFRSTATRPASALAYKRRNSFALRPDNYARQVTLVDANAVYLEDPAADRDGDKAAVLRDDDGTVTGTAGAYVAANSPLLLTDACQRRAEWNASVCRGRFVRLGVRSEGGQLVAPLRIRRDDGVSDRLVGTPGVADNAYMSLPAGRRYAIQFETATAPTRPRIHVESMQPGDWVVVAIPYASSGFVAWRDWDRNSRLRAAASVDAVAAGAGDLYHWADGVLYVKAAAQLDRSWATVFVDPA